MKHLIFLSILSVVLLGCETIKESPPVALASQCVQAEEFNNNAKKACASAIIIIVQTADTLADQGAISSDAENTILDLAQKAKDTLVNIKDAEDESGIAKLYGYITTMTDLIN